MPKPTTCPFTSHTTKTLHPHVVPYRKDMQVINLRYCIYTSQKWHQSRPLLLNQRSEEEILSKTEQMLSQWELQWRESERESDLLSLLKNQFWDGKALVISEWWRMLRVLYRGVWVRHLWPSGDWEPVFACQESRSNRHRIGQDDLYGLCMLS